MTRTFTARYFALITVFLLCFCNARPASRSTQKELVVDDKVVLVPPKPVAADTKNVPLHPNCQLRNYGHGFHLQKIDELGKLHRFHKERIKKAKKHQNKFWVIAKLLIIACQVALLIHAFMHLTH